MNVLFLTIGRFESIESHSIYTDLLREFRRHGNNVYIVSSREKRQGLSTGYYVENDVMMLRVCTGNITKCGMIEKGISTLLIEHQYKKAIKKYLSDITFDLILYSTPPITLVGVVEYVKKRDFAKTYLLLKDIFPQNAIDLGLLHKSGVKGVIYRYFRKKEKKLYGISDHIGCMSQANVDYVLKHNLEVNKERVGICPNCIEPRNLSLSLDERIFVRQKFGLPQDKKIFLYGGNLGKPQGIPFLIKCLHSQKNNADVFFLIAGDGTEYGKIADFIENEKPQNVRLIKSIPKEDYDRMVAACDVGMIFLDYRFTIPNFPSRILSYMQAGIPILACTDTSTDVGQVILDAEIGWWCDSSNSKEFSDLVSFIIKQDLSGMSSKIIRYLDMHYNVALVYQNILDIYMNGIQ